MLEWLYNDIIEEQKEEWQRTEALQAFVNPEIYTAVKKEERQGSLMEQIKKTEKIMLKGIEYRNKRRKERAKLREQQEDIGLIA